MMQFGGKIEIHEGEEAENLVRAIEMAGEMGSVRLHADDCSLHGKGTKCDCDPMLILCGGATA